MTKAWWAKDQKKKHRAIQRSVTGLSRTNKEADKERQQMGQRERGATMRDRNAGDVGVE